MAHAWHSSSLLRATLPRHTTPSQTTTTWDTAHPLAPLDVLDREQLPRSAVPAQLGYPEIPRAEVLERLVALGAHLRGRHGCPPKGWEDGGDAGGCGDCGDMLEHGGGEQGVPPSGCVRAGCVRGRGLRVTCMSVPGRQGRRRGHLSRLSVRAPIIDDGYIRLLPLFSPRGGLPPVSMQGPGPACLPHLAGPGCPIPSWQQQPHHAGAPPLASCMQGVADPASLKRRLPRGCRLQWQLGLPATGHLGMGLNETWK